MTALETKRPTLRIEVDNDNPSLPFEIPQQQALVGHIMCDDKFYMQLRGRIASSWFADSVVAEIFKKYEAFYDTFSRVPNSKEEFKGWPGWQDLDNAKRIQAFNGVEICYAKSATFGRDYISAQLTAWQKTRALVRDLPQVGNLISSRQLSQAEGLIHSLSKDLLGMAFDGTAPVDFRNPRKILANEEFAMEGALTTGLPLLDSKLLPEGNGKVSLLLGDTTLILAPTNSGKTTAMGTIARHNAAKGRNVLFIGREGRENDLSVKFLQTFMGKTKAELFGMAKTEEGGAFMDKVGAMINKHLTFVHVTKQGFTVEECIGIIRSMQALRKAQYGVGYDLLCVDYPGILDTERARGGKYEYRQVQDYIYRQFVQLALEEKFHCLAAVQTNREGLKITSGESEHSTRRLLTPEHISEAYAIAMSATTILTLNRDPVAAAQNRLTWYICKSRSSATGWAVTCRSDYSRATTHSPKLPATAYLGSSTMNEQIETLLQNYSGRDIPIDYVNRTRNDSRN
jgi:hypothetical protein